MIRIFFGLLWIGCGLIFLSRPGVLRAWLRWRSLRRIRWTLFWFALGAGVSLVAAAWPLPGWLAKIIVVVGLFAIVKACYFLKCESSEWLIERMADLPEEAYRWCALAYVFIGLLLVFMR